MEALFWRMKMFLSEYIVERSCLDSWVFTLNVGLLHLFNPYLPW